MFPILSTDMELLQYAGGFQLFMFTSIQPIVNSTCKKLCCSAHWWYSILLGLQWHNIEAKFVVCSVLKQFGQIGLIGVFAEEIKRKGSKRQ